MIELATPALRCAYLPLADLPHAESDILGGICFSETSSAAPGLPLTTVHMPALVPDHAAASTTCEIWRGSVSICNGHRNSVHYRHDGALLFGTIQLDENDYIAADKTPLQQATKAAYRAVFDTVDTLGFPHILRFWNYMGDINGDSHGMERYRQFNIGRQEGFLASDRPIAGGAVPAASAVGCDGGPLTVCFLASRAGGVTAIENPRQVSAYDYPDQYGPRRPTFSRAGVTELGGHELLFLSGTASIVGHRSLHAGDVAAQTRETLENIKAILDQANRSTVCRPFTLDELCCKVYVRRAEDAGIVRNELRRALGTDARLLLLRADICRRELLLEVEAVASHATAAAESGLS